MKSRVGWICKVGLYEGIAGLRLRQAKAQLIARKCPIAFLIPRVRG